MPLWLQIHVARVSRIWFRITTFLFLDQDFTQSGINLFSDQSPPPTTFPALAIPILGFFFLEKN